MVIAGRDENKLELATSKFAANQMMSLSVTHKEGSVLAVPCNIREEDQVWPIKIYKS